MIRRESEGTPTQVDVCWSGNRVRMCCWRCGRYNVRIGEDGRYIELGIEGHMAWPGGRKEQKWRGGQGPGGQSLSHHTPAHWRPSRHRDGGPAMVQVGACVSAGCGGGPTGASGKGQPPRPAHDRCNSPPDLMGRTKRHADAESVFVSRLRCEWVCCDWHVTTVQEGVD